MKKLLITTLIIISTYGFSANAESNLEINDNGAALKLGNIHNATYGFAVASTGDRKYSAFTPDSSIGAASSGTESEMGFSYDQPINEKLNTNFKFSYRNDVNNTAGASDGAAILRFNYKLN